MATLPVGSSNPNRKLDVTNRESDRKTTRRKNLQKACDKYGAERIMIYSSNGKVTWRKKTFEDLFKKELCD